jgi:hypothetical protein
MLRKWKRAAGLWQRKPKTLSQRERAKALEGLREHLKRLPVEDLKRLEKQVKEDGP